MNSVIDPAFIKKVIDFFTIENKELRHTATTFVETISSLSDQVINKIGRAHV